MAANDWIRLNKGFITKPEVVRTAVALKVDKWRAAGAWITILDWADDLTEDGFIPRLDGDAIDAIVDLPGFFAVACAVGWMAVDADGVRFLNYTRYNTKSAKARSVDAKRQAKKRHRGQNSDETRTELGHNSDETRTKVRATYTETVTDTRTSKSSQSVDPNAQAHLPRRDASASLVESAAKPEFSSRVEAIYNACTWKRDKPRTAKKAIQAAGRRVTARYLGDSDKAMAYLLERVKAYAGSVLVATTPKQYLPGPAPWFNGDKFDEPDEEWAQARNAGTDSDGPTLEVA